MINNDVFYINKQKDMTKIGILCPPASGHLNPMIALGYEIQKRGHHVTLVGFVDAQPIARAAGLDFLVIGEYEYPSGSVANVLAHLGELSGLFALQYTINQYKQGAIAVLRDAPRVIRNAKIEALLIDQSTLEGGTVADFLGIPFITISNALILNADVEVPPALIPWEYDTAWWTRLRNLFGYSMLMLLGQSVIETVADYRKQWNLPPYSYNNEPFSKLAQISQQPSEFEFPRKSLPSYFHFVGPLVNPVTRQSINFPWEQLTGQPLIYASLGTIQNRLLWVFQRIAEACVAIDAQLVISLGGAMKPEILGELPGKPLVVEYAPQLEILQKATLTITHAGLNTTLESLSNGVPMVAIPIANDQPGVAARISWTGTGEVVQLNQLNTSQLKTAINKVLTEYSYKRNAIRLQQAIQQSGGVSRAVDIVIQAISTGKPVYR